MRRARTRARVDLLWCLSICLAIFLCALIARSNCLDIRSSSLEAQHKQVVEGAAEVRRRSLGGPGSFPPRCIGKCDQCMPCSPVHVTVPPGTPVTTEYYPEAWRCKCGNKLYIP